MDYTALSAGTFAVGSLTVAFAKYTLAKRKLMQIESNVKNPLRRF
jgi:hypothetical protein